MRKSDIIYYAAASVIIILGLFLRIRLYLHGYPFWWDETALADSILNRSLFQMFSPLNNMQTAPPLYLVLAKSAAEIFGADVFPLRAVSCLSGCCSLIFFYLLIIKVFKSRAAVLAALILFSFSAQLIYYSAEFKPYCTDVLLCVILLYFFSKFKINSRRDALCCSAAAFLAPFFSFPSAVVIFSMIALKLFEPELKNKSMYFMLFFPVLISLFIIWQIEKVHYTGMADSAEWKDCFFSLSLKSNINLICRYISCIHPFYDISVFWLYALGFLKALFSKNKYIHLSLLCIFFTAAASFLHLYPFSGRVILFLMPLFIIIGAGILDFNSCKNVYLKSAAPIFKLLVIAAAVLSFNLVPNIKAVSSRNFLLNEPASLRFDRQKAVLKFFKHYKRGDLLITTNKVSAFLKLYGKMKYDFQTDKIICRWDISSEKEIEKIKNEIIKIKNNDIIVLYFNPWYFDEENRKQDIFLTEQMIKSLNLKYEKYPNEYADLYKIYKSDEINN